MEIYSHVEFKMVLWFPYFSSPWKWMKWRERRNIFCYWTWNCWRIRKRRRRHERGKEGSKIEIWCFSATGNEKEGAVLLFGGFLWITSQKLMSHHKWHLTSHDSSTSPIFTFTSCPFEGSENDWASFCDRGISFHSNKATTTLSRNESTKMRKLN